MYDPDAMKPLVRLTALGICALLVSVPVAAGCLGSGMMADDCPMLTEQTTVSSADMPCHQSAPPADLPVSDDCCDGEVAPEPIQAPSFETVKLIIALEAAELPVADAAAPPAQLILRKSAESPSERDVGRYTLFSSLLL